MSTFSIKTNEGDSGVLLVTDCPKCEQEQHFNLIARSVAPSLLGISFKRSKEFYDARCAGCSYEMQILPDDVPLLEPMYLLTQRLLEKQISKDQYNQELRAIPAVIIGHLLALTEDWECPECQEVIPSSFLQCWNCSYEKEIPVDQE